MRPALCFAAVCAATTPGFGAAADPAAADPAVSTPLAAGSVPEVDLDFLDDLARTYRFRSGTPGAFAFADEGKHLLYLRSGPRDRVQDLYEHEVATGLERRVVGAQELLGGAEENLSAEEQARRERQRSMARGLASFELSPDGRSIVVPLSGQIYVVDRASGTSRVVAGAVAPDGSAEPIVDPHLSPDGSTLAFVRGADLRVLDLRAGTERVLAAAGGPSVTCGLAEFIAQEELDRSRGYWWSPTSDRIVFARVDSSAIPLWHVLDPLRPELPPAASPYPAAGGTNADVRLEIATLEGGPTIGVRWDRAAFPYVLSVRWPEGAPLSVVVANRAQTEALLLAVDPSSGATRVLVEERDPTWVDVPPTVPAWSGDGQGFYWISDRAGWPELQRRDAEGRLLGTLAGEELGFRALLHHDPSSGRVRIEAGRSPLESRVLCLDPRKTGRVEVVAEGPGQWGAVGDPKSRALVLSHQGPGFDRSWLVRDGKGRAAPPLRSVAEAPARPPNIEWTQVEHGGHLFHAAIIRPRDFDPHKRYPVLHQVYAGPTARVVGPAGLPYALHQWFADQGFIVVAIDNRGTPDRGRTWSRAWKLLDPSGRGNLIDLALSDQRGALQALLGRYGELDASRVGVYGWSFGGYFAAMAALRGPDLWRAACAGAPVCSWEDYDTAYTERYLGLPADNAEGYRQSNVLTWADDLSVPLLLVHGTADDNVYWAHTGKLADRLFRSGRDFDLLVLPGLTHMVPDPEVVMGLYGRIARFFRRSLGAPTPSGATH